MCASCEVQPRLFQISAVCGCTMRPGGAQQFESFCCSDALFCRSQFLPECRGHGLLFELLCVVFDTRRQTVLSTCQELLYYPAYWWHHTLQANSTCQLLLLAHLINCLGSQVTTPSISYTGALVGVEADRFDLGSDRHPMILSSFSLEAI